MISIVIATRNSETTLLRCLSSIVSGAVNGIVSEVIVVDDHSTDGTRTVADKAGCTVVTSGGSRGKQLKFGASKASRGKWLLFLGPETVLEEGWEREVELELSRLDCTGQLANVACVFRHGGSELSMYARLREFLANLGMKIFGKPNTKQGLIVLRKSYDSVDGHNDLDQKENIDLIRRLKPVRIIRLNSRARVSEPSAVQ